MLANTQTVDEVQGWIDAIICSSDSIEEQLIQLAELEPTICDHYARGLTQVKPVHMMTEDDLVG